MLGSNRLQACTGLALFISYFEPGSTLDETLSKKPDCLASFHSVLMCVVG